MLVTADNIGLLSRLFAPEYWTPRKIGESVPDYHGEGTLEDALNKLWCLENGFAPVRMVSLAEMREIYGRNAGSVDER